MNKDTRFWNRQDLKKIFGYLLLALLVAAFVILMADDAVSHIQSFESWSAELGAWSLLVFVLLYILLCSMLFPESLLGIIAGVTFGMTQGILVIVVGSLAAALLQYCLAKTLVRPIINKKIASKPALKAIQSAVLEQQLKLQVLLRLTPLNRAVTSYILGATGVGVTRFSIACIAMFPNLLLEVYLGYAGKTLTKVAAQGSHTFWPHEAVTALSVLIAFIVIAFVAKIAQRAINSATKNSSPIL